MNSADMNGINLAMNSIHIAAVYFTLLADRANGDEWLSDRAQALWVQWHALRDERERERMSIRRRRRA